MPKSDTPKPPAHLSVPSRRLWTAILRDWAICDAAHLRVLQSALEALDRAERCRVQIDADGEMVLDRFGQKKSHPLLSAERDARSAFLTAVKALGLDPQEIT